MTRGRKGSFIVWLASIVTIVLTRQANALLDRFGLGSAVFNFIEATGWIVCVALTLWFIALGIRYILRKLFWRVGRRLLLSYILIGGLPFVFFAVLLALAGYIIAGVLSQAAFRAERQAALTRLDQLNLEYTLTGVKPAGPIEIEIYDSAEASGQKIPDWLRRSSFIGLVRRDEITFFVSSRIYQVEGNARNVVFAQPIDESWIDYLARKNGMYIEHSVTRARHVRAGDDVRIRVSEMRGDQDPDGDVNLDDNLVKRFLKRALRRNGVVWGDLSPPLNDWSTGSSDGEDRIFTFISNPWSNLLDFYFGGPEYLNVLLGIVLGIASLLAIVYLLASLLAAVMIFSISRAVNRIERGTKAVEKGDFSYKIGLKPRNQLGEVAASFDHMTSSIGSLLSKVAEQERLQSEIHFAAEIQRNLLPKEGPHIAGVSFSAHFEPTATIGGDYYDLFDLEDGRLGVAIGDVSGHGLSTGLVMAMVKAALSTLVEEGADQATLFVRLNDLVVRSTEKRAFMTLAFTTFDFGRRMIYHTNAGHLYPYLLRKGERPTAIEAPSLPLGVKSSIEPRTAELPFCEGDAIVYLSDGIVEAQDEMGNPFGFDKLEQILGTSESESPAAIQELILAAVAIHCGSRPADDDRTVMILRFDQLPERVALRDGEPIAEELAPDELSP